MHSVSAMAEAIDLSIEHLLRARHLLDYHEQTAATAHETVLIAHSVAIFIDMGIDVLTGISSISDHCNPLSATLAASERCASNGVLTAPRHDEAPIGDINIDIAIWHRMRWRKQYVCRRWGVAG